MYKTHPGQKIRRDTISRPERERATHPAALLCRKFYASFAAPQIMAVVQFLIIQTV